MNALEPRRLLAAMVAPPDAVIYGDSVSAPLSPRPGHSFYVSGMNAQGVALSQYANASAITPNIVNDLVLNVAPFDTNYAACCEGAGGVLNANLLTNGITQNQTGPVTNPAQPAPGDGGASDASNNTNTISDINTNFGATTHFSYVLNQDGGGSPSSTGYDLSEIDVITGHQDSRAAIGQVDVLVETVGSNEFLSLSNGSGFSLTTVPDGKGGTLAIGKGAEQMAIVSTTPGQPLATHVQAVELLVSNTQTFFREFVASGTASGSLPTPPASPANVSATLAGTGALVGWNASAGATGYTVLRATSPSGPYAALGSVTTQTTFTDSTIQPNTTYYYQVIASGNGDSAASSPVSFTLPSTAGATAYFFQGTSWAGAPAISETIPAVDLIGSNTQTSYPLASGFNANAFSTFIEGKVTTDLAGMYTFVTNTDDDGYLFVNGQLVSSDPGAHVQRLAPNVYPISLAANAAYNFVLLEANRTNGWGMFMSWQEPTAGGGPGPLTLVPATKLSPVVDSPPTPGTLMANPTTATSVQLTWPITSDASSYAYIIERAPADGAGNPTGAFAKVGQVFSGPALGAVPSHTWGTGSFTDFTPKAATNYVYEVGSIIPGQAAPASFSPIQSVTTPAAFTPVSVSWSGAGDGVSWSDPNNWSNHAVPTSSNAVTINPATPTTIQVNSAATAYSVVSNQPLSFNSGTFNVTTTAQISASIFLNGGTLVSGTWSSPNNAYWQVNANGSTLQGLTLATTLWVDPGVTLHVTQGLTVNGILNLYSNLNGPAAVVEADGTQTIAGTGQIVFAGQGTDQLLVDSPQNASGATLTLGPSLKVLANNWTALGVIAAGDTYPETLVNQGTVNSNTSGDTIQIGNFASVQNLGTLEATFGVLSVANLSNQPGGTVTASASSSSPSTAFVPIVNLSGTWSNAGNLTESNAVLNLGGTMTTAGLGLAGMTRSNGTVNLTGSLDNSNATLALTPATGSWNLQFATITGGTIAASGGASMVLTGTSTLDGVTLNANLTMTANGLNVRDGLTLNGTLTMRSPANSTMVAEFIGTQTLGGTGQVVFAGAGSEQIDVNSTGSASPPVLTIGAGVMIHGAAGATSFGLLSHNDSTSGELIVNLGTINADVPGQTITYNFASNSGIATANSGTLDVTGMTGNLGGGYSVSHAGRLVFNATNYVLDSGLLAPAGTLLELDGTWTNAAGSTISATGATLNLNGTWSNSGSIAASSSAVELSGSPTVGTFSLSGPAASLNLANLTSAQIQGLSYGAAPVSVTGTLNNTSATFAVPSAWVMQGLTITGGTLTLPAGSPVTASQGTTLNGVTINGNLLVPANGLYITNGLTLNGILTLASTSTPVAVQFTGTQTLTGNGQVVFDGSGQDELLVNSGGGPGAAVLTVASGITIHGAPGATAGGLLSKNDSASDSIVNQGAILSDAPGQNIVLAQVSNHGTAQAAAGTLTVTGLTGNIGGGYAATAAGTLVLNGSAYVIDSGLSVGPGATLVLSGTWTNAANSTISAIGAVLTLGSGANAWTNSGAITAISSSVNLGGSLTTASIGTLGISGGTVSLTGLLNNSNATLTLRSGGSDWTLAGGTILGGTVSGAPLSDTGGGVLDGVTLASDLAVVSAPLTILDGLTLQNGASIVLNSTATHPATVEFANTQTLGGQGRVVFNGDRPATEGYVSIGQNGQSATLTVGPQVSIATGTGSGAIGGGIAGSQLFNQGSLAAQTPDASLTVIDPLVEQGGAATASNGGFLNANINGVLTFIGGAVSLNAAPTTSNITVQGGDIAFNSATPVAVQTLTLTGGVLDGSSAITVAQSATFTGGSAAGPGAITLAPGASATVGGSVDLARTFNNGGTVDVQSGSLTLASGGAQSGSFQVESGATLNLTGGSESFSGGSSIAGAGTVVFAGTSNSTVNGNYVAAATVVQDTATVAFTATAQVGTLSLNGGTITIGQAALPPSPSGDLRAADATTSALNVITKTVLNGGTINVLASAQLVAGPQLVFSSGDTQINLASDNATPGSLLLAGDVTFSANTGSAHVQTTGTAAKPGWVDLGGTQRSFVTGTTSEPVSVGIAAPIQDGSLRKSGPGLMQLTYANSYSGGTEVSDGSLEADNPGALGKGAVIFDGGKLALRCASSSFTLPNAFTAAATDSISVDLGALSGTGSFRFQVPSLTLGAALNVTGTGTFSITGPVVLQADATINNSADVLISGTISGGFGLSKTQTATLTFAGAVANTYTGPTTIYQGTLLLADFAGLAVPSDLYITGPSLVRLATSQQIASSATVHFDSVPGLATLDLAGHTQTLAALGDVNGGSILMGGGTMNLGATNQSFSFGGTITGGGQIVKTGTGVFSFPNASSFGGTLSVNGGSMSIPYGLVNSGTMTVAPGTSLTIAGALTGPGTIVVGGTSGSAPAVLQVGSFSQAAVVINATGTLRVGPGSTATNATNSLSIAPGGILDLGSSSLSLSYTSGSDPLSAIRTLLSGGYGSGKWDGSGITSSAAGANPSLYTLSYVDSSDTTGVNPTANSILIRYGLIGDLNGDGSVNLADLLALTRNFGKTGSDSALGDVDFNGSTSISDFLALTRNFGKTLTPSLTPTTATAPKPVGTRRV